MISYKVKNADHLQERPFGIVISAKNRRTQDLERMLREMVSVRILTVSYLVRFFSFRRKLILKSEKHVQQDAPGYQCQVEIRDPMVAKVYSMSKRSQEDFPNFPEELREAISLGRQALDPAVEVAQLFNQDDDVLCLQLSPFQVHFLRYIAVSISFRLYCEKIESRTG